MNDDKFDFDLMVDHITVHKNMNSPYWLGANLYRKKVGQDWSLSNLMNIYHLALDRNTTIIA